MRRVLVLIALLCANCSDGTKEPITGSLLAELADSVTGKPYTVDIKFKSEVMKYDGQTWKYTYSLTNANTKPVTIDWTALPGNGPAEQVSTTFVSLLPPVIDYSHIKVYDGEQLVTTGAGPAYVPQRFSREEVIDLFKQTGRSSVYFSDGDQFIYLVQHFLDASQCGSGFRVYGLRLRANQMSLRDLPPDSIEIGRAHAQSEVSDLMIQNENVKFGNMENWSCQDEYSRLNEIARLNDKITAADRAHFDRIMSLTAFSLQKLGPRSR